MAVSLFCVRILLTAAPKAQLLSAYEGVFHLPVCVDKVALWAQLSVSSAFVLAWCPLSSWCLRWFHTFRLGSNRENT